MYIYVFEYAEFIFKLENAIQAILRNIITKTGDYGYKNALNFRISRPSFTD